MPQELCNASASSTLQRQSSDANFLEYDWNVIAQIHWNTVNIGVGEDWKDGTSASYLSLAQRS